MVAAIVFALPTLASCYILAFRNLARERRTENVVILIIVMEMVMYGALFIYDRMI